MWICGTTEDALQQWNRIHKMFPYKWTRMICRAIKSQASFKKYAEKDFQRALGKKIKSIWLLSCWFLLLFNFPPTNFLMFYNFFLHSMNRILVPDFSHRKINSNQRDPFELATGEPSTLCVGDVEVFCEWQRSLNNIYRCSKVMACHIRSIMSSVWIWSLFGWLATHCCCIEALIRMTTTI